MNQLIPTAIQSLAKFTQIQIPVLPFTVNQRCQITMSPTQTASKHQPSPTSTRKTRNSLTPQPTCSSQKSAPYKVINVTSRQKGSPIETEEDVSTTVARILLIAEQTDISLPKWIEETDRDHIETLISMKQATLD